MLILQLQDKLGHYRGFTQNSNCTHLSFGGNPEAGLRLRKAFNHLVFIDVELAIDNLRSVRGDPGSLLPPKNSSFCKKRKRKHLKPNKFLIIIFE